MNETLKWLKFDDHKVLRRFFVWRLYKSAETLFLFAFVFLRPLDTIDFLTGVNKVSHCQ